jgi:hypothetical protein
MQKIALSASPQPNRGLRRRNECRPKGASLFSRIEVVLGLLHTLDDHRCLGGPPSQISLLFLVKPHGQVVDKAAHCPPYSALQSAHPPVVADLTDLSRRKFWTVPTLRRCIHRIPVFSRRLRVRTDRRDEPERPRVFLVPGSIAAKETDSRGGHIVDSFTVSERLYNSRRGDSARPENERAAITTPSGRTTRSQNQSDEKPVPLHVAAWFNRHPVYKSMYATDATFLNDSQEVVYA